MCAKARKFFLPPGLPADFGRLCHWSGKCVALSYITGKYGGAAFVLVYLLFLVIMGLPVMVMEFSVGRASRKSILASFQVLEPRGASGTGTAGSAWRAITC